MKYFVLALLTLPGFASRTVAEDIPGQGQEAVKKAISLGLKMEIKAKFEKIKASSFVGISWGSSLPAEVKYSEAVPVRLYEKTNCRGCVSYWALVYSNGDKGAYFIIQRIGGQDGRNYSQPIRVKGPWMPIVPENASERAPLETRTGKVVESGITIPPVLYLKVKTGEGYLLEGNASPDLAGLYVTCRGAIEMLQDAPARFIAEECKLYSGILKDSSGKGIVISKGKIVDRQG